MTERLRGRLALYPAPNAPFEIREFPLRGVAPGEVLVRVSMCTICGSDVHSYRGRRPNPLPGLLGHEIIGVIEEIGGRSLRDLRGDALAPGDRVTWTQYFAVGPSWERDVLDMPQKSPDSGSTGTSGRTSSPTSPADSPTIATCFLGPES